ncbi:MAG: tyrosine--tRNA ligase [Candidatus Westeberhardia cardiocondylae]|nr:tyrosine--tRNA ligase [Candidatus Westeberhardia cardiocondylae]
MKNIDILNMLVERGLISQLSDKKKLTKLLQNQSITVYCGFDPTYDSLHIGHLLLLLCLKRFQLSGHRPIVLLGGATSLIGDPSFKLHERKLHILENIQKNTKKIIKQIQLFLDFDCGANSAIIVNNYDWFKNMFVLDFLRNIGKYFSINKMLHKKSIKDRINRIGHGITFAEFSYNLLQGYDFFYLYQKYNVVLQIGGADQWGNIVSGIDLVHRLSSHIVYGLTVPLITRSDGTKFGKSDFGKILWLDEKKTSIYDFYQFWINVSDEDVYRFLNFFTFLDIHKIRNLFNQNQKKNMYINKNVCDCTPQIMLAKLVTKLVHGKYGLSSAQRITKKLFFLNVNKELSKRDFEQCINDGITVIFVKKNHVLYLQEALVMTNLAFSYRQAKDLIASKAILVNGNKQDNKKYIFTSFDKKYDCYTLICRGKKHYRLICWK